MNILKQNIGRLNDLLEQSKHKSDRVEFESNFQSFIKSIHSENENLECDLNLMLFLWTSKDYASYSSLCSQLKVSSFNFESHIACYRYVNITALGVTFESLPNSNRSPRRKRLSSVFPFESYMTESPDLIATVGFIRFCTKYVCKVAEEWEFQNALLAIKQVQLISAFKSGSLPESDYITDAADVANKRNDVAIWCLDFLNDTQRWFGQMTSNRFAGLEQGSKNAHEDLVKELDALGGILLAAFQKILLPGSVSRHLFCERVRCLFLEWCALRQRHAPSDAATLFAKIHFQNSLDCEIDLSLVSRLLHSSHEFDLDFDPVSALKCVCWKTQPALLIYLATALGLCIAKKTYIKELPKGEIDCIADLLQMAVTFPQSNETLSTKPISFPSGLADHFLAFLKLILPEQVESKIFFEREIRKHFENIM